MWKFEQSIETTAAPESVWQLWSDVATWPTWDHGVTKVELNGPFKVDTTARLQLDGKRWIKFQLTEVTANKSFTDVTKLPLAKMSFSHHLSETPEGKTLITHVVEIDGLLTPLFKRVIGREIEQGLPGTLRKLAKEAEKLEQV